jgi:hypothetical protein
MANLAARPFSISVAALGAALIWGALECFALQWSRLKARLSWRQRF